MPHRAEADPVPLQPDEPLRVECQHFLDCIASGERPHTDGHEGLRVLRVLARATLSLRREDAAARPPAENRTAEFPGVHIHESAYIDADCTIGPGSRIWHFCYILPRTRMGRDCSFGQNIMAGPDVRIGDNCKIQNNVSLYKGVVLEDGVFCGPSCVFTNVLNPRAEIERQDVC